MVPEKLITADCHITPPLSIVDELPEHYREYFPRIEKDENGKDVYKTRPHRVHVDDDRRRADSDIQADATGAEGNVVSEAHSAWTPRNSSPTWSATGCTARC